MMTEPHAEPDAVALVTGAGRGLGRALAMRLAGHRFRLLLHCHRSRDGAEQVAAMIGDSGGVAQVVQADLTTEAGGIALAIAAREKFGRLDVLINNAGVYHEANLAELSEAEWFAGLNTTATATFFATRVLLPLLREAPTGGRVINIGDGSCDRPGARERAMGYHIGKTGVWMLTRSFAAREARHRVAVNLVSPGLLESSVGLVDNAAADGVPAGRYGTFEDVGAAVSFLATTETTYLTGANLTVGGGWNF